MRWVIMGAALALSGCSKGPDAEAEYNIVSGGSDPAATCAAAKKVADAYLADKNPTEYRKWVRTTDESCAIARLTSGAS